METIDGKALRLLGTRSAPGCLIDTWETSGATPSTHVVVTVMTDQETAAEPFYGWAGRRGLRRREHLASDPLGRLQEAIPAVESTDVVYDGLDDQRVVRT